MEISEIIIPSLIYIFPVALGWVLLSVVLGIRAGLEAGIRFLLFGLGLLGALYAIVATTIFLPNWAITALMLILVGRPCLQILRYLIYAKTSGSLWMVLPSRNEKLSVTLAKAAILTVLGLQNFIASDEFLTPYKHYALGLSLIILGVFEVVDRIRVTQIKEKGILHESGNFYKWENIGNYTWKLGDDKLSLNLKKYVLKETVNLKILSHFRYDVLAYLSQKLGNDSANYLPFQKAG